MYIIKKMIGLMFCGLLLSSMTPGENLAFNEARQVGTVTINQKKWISYTSKEGNFVVDFPTRPINLTQQNSQIVFSDGKDITYFVFTTPLTSEKEDFEAILQKALESSAEAELINKKKGTFQGQDALGFLFKRNQLFVEGLYLESNNTLYQVFAVYEQTPDNQEKFRRFIASFQLLNP